MSPVSFSSDTPASSVARSSPQGGAEAALSPQEQTPTSVAVSGQLAGLAERGMRATRGHADGAERLNLSERLRLDAARVRVAQYPDLNHLADLSVSVTNEAAGGSVPENSYSAGLGKSQHFVEFERSLQSLRCLDLLVDGGVAAYDEWTAAQTGQKLDYPSFQRLSNRWRELVKHYATKGIGPDELKRAAEVSLVLGDMGKAASVRTMMADLGIHDADHDDFYGHVMREPRALARLESFQLLQSGSQNLLRATASLAHFGHITHCEGGPQMFGKLKASNILSTDPFAFEFAALSHTCDVAGAQGHRNTNGSLTYSQATFDAIEATFDACRTLKHGNEESAYEELLQTRARWLGFSPDMEGDRMLARLGAMMRLTTPQQGTALKQGFSRLPSVRREHALIYLGIAGAEKLPRTPTWMPAVLVNLMSNPELGASPEERLSNAIEIGVPFITTTLEAYQAMLLAGEMSSDTPLNFNAMAGVAARTPTLLRTAAVTINPENGEVAN